MGRFAISPILRFPERGGDTGREKDAERGEREIERHREGDN